MGISWSGSRAPFLGVEGYKRQVFLSHCLSVCLCQSLYLCISLSLYVDLSALFVTLCFRSLSLYFSLRRSICSLYLSISVSLYICLLCDYPFVPLFLFLALLLSHCLPLPVTLSLVSAPIPLFQVCNPNRNSLFIGKDLQTAVNYVIRSRQGKELIILLHYYFLLILNIPSRTLSIKIAVNHRNTYIFSPLMSKAVKGKIYDSQTWRYAKL